MLLMEKIKHYQKADERKHQATKHKEHARKRQGEGRTPKLFPYLDTGFRKRLVEESRQQPSKNDEKT